MSPAKRKYFERHLRAETVFINGVMMIFYRCPKKRRWVWRAIEARVIIPDEPDSDTIAEPEPPRDA